MVEILYNDSQFYTIIMVLIWTFFIVLAEWKRDFIYFTMSTITSLSLGVYLLFISESTILHYFFGTAVILCGLYFSFLTFTEGVKGRKE